MTKKERNKAYKKAYISIDNEWIMMGLCAALSFANVSCRNCPEIKLFMGKYADNGRYWVADQLRLDYEYSSNLRIMEVRKNILAFAIAMTES